MNQTDRESLWVLRAQAGDRDALGLLLRSIQPSLQRVAHGLVGTSGSDDVVQETLILVYRNLGQLLRPELLRPWAFRIAKRVGLRHLKKERRSLEDPEEDAHSETIPVDETPPTDETLTELLEQGSVSPASRTVLVLHFQEGLSLPEVAAVLELPLGTVKSRLAYGLAVLRRRLHQHGSPR